MCPNAPKSYRYNLHVREDVREGVEPFAVRETVVAWPSLIQPVTDTPTSPQCLAWGIFSIIALVEVHSPSAGTSHHPKTLNRGTAFMQLNLRLLWTRWHAILTSLSIFTVHPVLVSHILASCKSVVPLAILHILVMQNMQEHLHIFVIEYLAP